MHQIKKQLSHPNFHRHHIQGDVLQSIHCQSNPPVTIAHSFPQSQIPRRYYRKRLCWRSCYKSITSYALATNHNLQITTTNHNLQITTYALATNQQPTLTSRIPPSKQLALREIPSTISTGLQKNRKNTEWYDHPKTAQSPTSRLWYLSSYHGALQAHKHPLHKLGNANTIANYHEYYQILIKNSTANGAASNVHLTAFYVPQRAVITEDISDGKDNQPFAELQQQYTTYCRLRKKQFKREKADEMVGLIDNRSPRCTNWWLQLNILTSLPFLLSHGLSTFNHILCNPKKVLLT